MVDEMRLQLLLFLRVTPRPNSLRHNRIRPDRLPEVEQRKNKRIEKKQR